MGGVLARTIEIACWHAKPHPLTKNLKWYLVLCTSIVPVWLKNANDTCKAKYDTIEWF